ncbi:MAG: hypothetical protein ABID63_01750 [Pseudomonadota bacterium]
MLFLFLLLRADQKEIENNENKNKRQEACQHIRTTTSALSISRRNQHQELLIQNNKTNQLPEYNGEARQCKEERDFALTIN